MFRLVVLSAVLISVSTLLFRGFSQTSSQIDPMSYVLGIMASGITGAIWFQIDAWRRAITRPFRPMTVELQTEQTPVTVVGGMLVAGFQVIITAVLGIILFWFLFTGL